VLAALVIFGGSLGDRLDKRLVLISGLGVYLAGNVAAIAAPDGTVLTVARVAAAMGACVLVPVGLAVLRTIATTAVQLARYMSAWGLAVGLGMALGPVFGGVLTDLLGWRWLFAALAVLAVIYLIMVWVFLEPMPPAGQARPFGWGQQALLALWMVSMTGWLIEVAGDSPAWLKVGLAVLAAGAFVAWQLVQQRVASPVVPRAAFKDRSFSVSMVMALVYSVGLGV
jgi:MFS family permease